MEKMQHIQILQIKEIPFEVNREVNITADMMKDVKFSFLIVLQHIKGNDVVGLHTVVRWQRVIARWCNSHCQTLKLDRIRR